MTDLPKIRFNDTFYVTFMRIRVFVLEGKQLALSDAFSNLNSDNNDKNKHLYHVIRHSQYCFKDTFHSCV